MGSLADRLKKPDIRLAYDGEFMLADAQGITEKGIEFIDSYITPAPIFVVDAGRILIPEREIEQFISAAYEQWVEVDYDH